MTKLEAQTVMFALDLSSEEFDALSEKTAAKILKVVEAGLSRGRRVRRAVSG